MAERCSERRCLTFEMTGAARFTAQPRWNESWAVAQALALLLLAARRQLRRLDPFSVRAAPGDAALLVHGRREDEFTFLEANGEHHAVRVKRQTRAISQLRRDACGFQ